MTWLQEALWASWRQPRDIAALAVFRMLFGGLMFVGTLRFMSCGWIDTLYLQPQFHFKYWGFSWVQVPSEVGLYLLYSGIALSALLVALGAFYRLAIISFWLLFSYAELMDVTTYLNHYYFVSLLALILCFLSPHRAWSVDALRKGTSWAQRSLPGWQTAWLRFQVGLLYFYAGWAKFEIDWLLHAQPLNIWLPPHEGMPLIGWLLDEVWVHYAFAWFAFVFDVTIIGFMLWKRSRPLAFAVILLFHLLTHVFFNIGLFPFIMVLAVLVFFEPDWPRKLAGTARDFCRSPAEALRATVRTWVAVAARGLGGTQARRVPGVEAPAASPGSQVNLRDEVPGLAEQASSQGHQAWQAIFGSRPVFTAVVLSFCAFQFVMPLRHWLYPGTVLWHEQGMRFSWRVMLREKSGALSYRVEWPDGQTRIVSPHDYLTPMQYQEMAGQPDMILQLAHHIRDDFTRRGHPPQAIYADSWVSLNGRPAQRMIVADANLAQIRDGIGRAQWITPAPSDDPKLHPPLRLVAR